jgi:hypothetical protein
MDKNEVKLVDSIKNIKTKTAVDFTKKIIKGCWRLFLILTSSFFVVAMIGNSFRHDSAYLIIPVVLIIIELRKNIISRLFFSLFK